MDNLEEHDEYRQGISQPVDFLPRGTHDCIICFVEVEVSDRYKYCLSHCICAECLEKYIETEIRNNSNEIKCPDILCKTKVELHHIKSIVKNDKVYKILERRIKEQKAQQDPSLYICTAPDCGNILRKPDLSNDQISTLSCEKCETGIVFYKDPSQDFPVALEDTNPDMAKSDQEIERRLYQGIIKLCPSCKAHMEKSEGCNHVTCKSCNQQFCWFCLKLWGRGFFDHSRCAFK